MEIKVTPELNEKFDERYEIVSESGCWIWTGWQVGKRYGKFWMKVPSSKGKHVLAHRYSYTRFHGQIPSDKHVCHRCDVPLCVNPDHLWLGTHQDNMADMAAKNRHSPAKAGAQNHSAKLTDDEVVAIFFASGTHKEIAAPYGIDASSVGRIKNGTNWSHITKNLHKCASA